MKRSAPLSAKTMIGRMQGATAKIEAWSFLYPRLALLVRSRSSLEQPTPCSELRTSNQIELCLDFWCLGGVRSMALCPHHMAHRHFLVLMIEPPCGEGTNFVSLDPN